MKSEIFFELVIIIHYLPIQVDKGTEFYNSNFREMLDALDVDLYSTYSDKKASIVERVQRTIRGRLFKLFTAEKNNKWIDALPKIIESYNNSVHRTIKMKPGDVKPEHTKTLLQRIYSNKKYTDTVKQEKYRKRLFKVNDLVRIVKERGFLEKEAVQKWTTEIFKIRKVERKNFPITYLLSDLNNEDILGSFYYEELQKAQ